MPVDVKLITKSGNEFIKRWDGKGDSQNITFRTSDKPERILLDPNDSILDFNLMNNGNITYKCIPDIPFSSYNPRRSYVIKYAPKLWYNVLCRVVEGENEESKDIRTSRR